MPISKGLIKFNPAEGGLTSAAGSMPVTSERIESKAGERLDRVPAASNAAIVMMISSGEISGTIAKQVLDYVFEHPETDPRQYVAEHNLRQVTDISALEKLVDGIVAKNPDKVGDAKTNPKAIGWFVGQVMKASGSKANPQAVNDLLKKRLGV
jgi:aspartyl-tRNA(Asn)/glutamyl-tRNA(Gln) amidotransferase subunit B